MAGNPAILIPMLQELGKANPQLLQVRPPRRPAPWLPAARRAALGRAGLCRGRRTLSLPSPPTCPLIARPAPHRPATPRRR